MSKTKPYRVYANTDAGRLGAQLSRHPDGRMQALVWRVGGGTLGFYNLDRFEGGKLTGKTLAKLFARNEGVTP